MQQRMEQMKEQVLKMLEADGGYVSGEYLSRMLGVSRTAVWKVIKRLREEGYIIDLSQTKGTALKESLIFWMKISLAGILIRQL